MARMKSLVAQAKAQEEQPLTPVEPAGAGGLLGVLDSYKTPGLVPVPVQAMGAYIGFVPSKGGNVAKFVAAGMGEGDPYLHHADGHDEALKPLRFAVLHGKRFFVETDDAYNPLGVKLEDPKDHKSPFKEVWESLLLVFTPSGVVPARCTWRSARTTAIKVALNALDAASKPDWVKQSPAHAATMQTPYPFFRFTATVTGRKRTAKGSGRTYFEAVATIAPTTLADIEQFNALTEVQVREAEAAYKAACGRLEALVK